MDTTRQIEPQRSHAQKQSHNVGRYERALSVAVGAAALIGGISRRGISGLITAAIGVALIHRGASGHCAIYDRLEIDSSGEADRTTGVPSHQGIHIVESITINRPREEVYRFWSDLRNLPQFMKHLTRIDVRPEGESHWVATGPLGQTLEWDARVIHEKSDELIAWESLPGSDLQSAGSVRFSDAPGGRGTELKVSMVYHPPFGKLGDLGARIVHQAPDQQLREDLRRLRQLLEAGELTTASAS